MGTLGDMLVLVDFKGQLDDELKIKTGDVIQNVKKTAEEGWLEGEFNGKRGFFPQMFVKEIPPFFLNDNAQRYPRSIRKPNASIVPKNPQEELPDTQAPTDDGYAGVNKKKRWCRVEYTYKASSADELDLSVGDTFEVLEEIEDGWYLGKKGDVVGAFPSNFVKEIPEPPSDKIPEHSKNAKKRPAMMDINFSAKEEGKCKQDDKPVPENQSKDSSLPQAKEYCRVMFNYIPFLPDELALKKGDVILLISKETGDEGWWQGEHNGKTGLFPDNFVIPIPPDMQNKTNKLPTRTSTIKGPETKSDLNIMDKKPQEVNKSAAEVNKHEPTATKGQKGQREPKADHTPKVNNQPAKKSAPPPPVPNKVKHNVAGPSNKPSTETGEDVNHSSKESNTLDGLRLSSVKLAHPTADRPKMMGKRLPKGKKPVAESDDKKAEEKVNSHNKVSSSAKDPRISSTTSPASSPTKTSSLSPLAASTMKQSQETSENHVSSVQSLKVEDVAAEIASLKFMMDLLRNKHAKDMEDIRSEMNEERAKRLALQMEVEHLKNLSSA
ncbi:SH3 domain containing 21 L homeolog isoform X1 [Xenopus laevis]|uniref:SH3 domain containing 21 L homeolog isoform X1 n=1 Tax=Xenopus laevis TaxID=8355 RepID=A0A8J1M4U2_XENLA|nr:SH3 domain containing 21 L homeolog isoform X1 [Xenopus laevis]